MKYFIAITVIFLSLNTLFSQNEISYRLVADDYAIDDTEVSVDIQVRTMNGDMNLADQYYRFYYDAGNMKLNDVNIESELPAELYYSPEVVEHIDGFDASRIGVLDYDQNLGFVNLYIELSDLTTGGMVIRPVDGWITVATIEFTISDTAQPIHATWARQAVTKDYASAFSIVSEWIQPQVIAVAQDYVYDDLYAIANKRNNSNQPEIKIGPNPTADYIKIRNIQFFDDNTRITLKDLNGATLQSINISNETEATIDLSNYQSGTYIIEISNAAKNQTIREKIIFTRS